MPRVLILVVVSAAAWSCGAKRPDPRIEAARLAAELRATAETRLLEGCYDCLLEAKTAYGKLATNPVADRAHSLLRLFEVEILIALREKELAIEAGPALARARALAPQLPATVPAARYLRVAEAIPPDASGLPIVADGVFRRAQAEYVSGLDAELVWMFGDQSLQAPVRDYLALALDCSYLRRARPATLKPVPGQPVPATPTRQSAMGQVPKDSPAVVRYRVAICDRIARPSLERVRTEDPRWAEAAYFMARFDVARASETGAREARPLLTEVHKRFPNSPAVTYLAGNYNQQIGDCKAALGFYDETLALQPVHDNALLGRTICLANLKRFDESIANATKMIEIPSVYLGDAYYWRAWIRHYLKDLPRARADIEQAKRVQSNNSIHRLAGIIEYDQDDLPAADKDLNDAKAASEGQYDCVARWYLGLLEMKRDKWTLSAANFEDSMGCYDRAALFAQEGLKKMLAMKDIDEEFRARQVAGFEAAIKEDTAQMYASAFNAANHYARGGNPAKAKVLLEIAAKDPTLESRVAELRKILGGG